jgi:hypothetical protein
MYTTKVFFVQNVPFIMSPSTTALSHIKPASAGASRESRSTQGHDKGDTLHIAIQTLASKMMCITGTYGICSVGCT